MRSLDDRYASAVNSGDLRTKSGHDDVEALVSVAWNRSRLGAALMRVHSEWQAVSRLPTGEPEQAFLQMKSLPHVHQELLRWAELRKSPHHHAMVPAVLFWWLHSTCRPCNGTRYVTVENRPKRPCTACHGTGKARIPHGGEGRALLAYIEACVYRGRSSTKGRLG